MRHLLFLFIFAIACSPKTQVKKETDNPKQEALSIDKSKENTIEFPSKDGLTITADLYKNVTNSELILLCHQAMFSRGEYIKTAPKLLAMGYNCIAIDQRSGMKANGVYNKTHKAAKKKNTPTNYVAAKQDIEAAIDYAFELNGKQPIILVGSSYSASWVLNLAVNNPKVKKVAAFSPGEYFRNFKLKESLKELKIPTFITCSRKEIKKTGEVIQFVDPNVITFYKPEEKGIHGSRALWEKTNGSAGYWVAFSAWLKGS